MKVLSKRSLTCQIWKKRKKYENDAKWVRVGDSYTYYKKTTGKYTQEGAREICRDSYGAGLVTIRNEEELQKMKSWASDAVYWIGLTTTSSDIDDRKNWVWDNDGGVAPGSDIFWFAGTDPNDVHFKCATWWDSNGIDNHYPCDTKKRGICEVRL